MQNFSELTIKAKSLLRQMYEEHNSNNHLKTLETTQELFRVVGDLKWLAIKICSDEDVNL